MTKIKTNYMFKQTFDEAEEEMENMMQDIKDELYEKYECKNDKDKENVDDNFSFECSIKEV